MTGPLSALVLERALSGKRESATLSALGGSLVEGVIAASLGSFVPQLLAYSDSLVRTTRTLGALVVFSVGLLLILRPGLFDSLDSERRVSSLRAGVLTTALNPTLFATWTLAVTSLFSAGWLVGGLVQGLEFGCGVALGSFSWLVLIVLVVSRLGRSGLFKHKALLMRIIGLILCTAGVVLFVQNLKR